MRQRTIIASTWVLAGTVLFLCGGPAGQAQAHASLLSSTPAANAMAMPPPTEVRLKFSEPVELKFTKIKVTGPGDAVVKVGSARLDEKDKTVVIVPFTAPLPDGEYKVDWNAVAKDTHKTKGTFSFTSMQ